jgi:hypothetical protein
MRSKVIVSLCCALLAVTGTAYGDFVNGDFELGAVGFSTDYAQANANTGPGQYTVTTTPSMWKSGYTDPTGHDQMLVADGSTSPDKVWIQSVSLTGGVTYSAASFAATSLTSAGGEYADLGLWVMPDAFSATKLAELTLDGSSVGVWKTSTNVGSFTPSSSGSYEFFIGDLNFAETGNVFAIDDITVVPEPSSLALFGIGAFIFMGVYTRRRKKA